MFILLSSGKHLYTPSGLLCPQTHKKSHFLGGNSIQKGAHVALGKQQSMLVGIHILQLYSPPFTGCSVSGLFLSFSEIFKN